MCDVVKGRRAARAEPTIKCPQKLHPLGNTSAAPDRSRKTKARRATRPSARGRSARPAGPPAWPGQRGGAGGLPPQNLGSLLSANGREKFFYWTRKERPKALILLFPRPPVPKILSTSTRKYTRGYSAAQSVISHDPRTRQQLR